MDDENPVSISANGEKTHRVTEEPLTEQVRISILWLRPQELLSFCSIFLIYLPSIAWAIG